MARDSRLRFSDRVADYVAARPGYPAGLIDVLLELSRHDRSRRIADVGAGTGLMARSLIERGLDVVAVEPNEAMRAAAEGVPSVAGSAEATALDDASVGGIVAAQAFHWFERDRAALEWRRILQQPGGWVALVWNRRLKTGDAFAVGYEALLVEHGTDYGVVDHTRIRPEEIEAFFGGAVGYRRVHHQQRFDFAGMRSRLLSSSYAPAEGQPGHEAMIARARELFESCAEEGRVTMRYVCELFCGPFG